MLRYDTKHGYNTKPSRGHGKFWIGKDATQLGIIVKWKHKT
jgi:hypothetical protein